ncbi:COP1-interacting protein 7 [Cardamine amara subsp. amara]|uniref:COP1-interacting protein 7 n=1 Tax=Cardamine amara subsp. amara TaxID=228776 RepID=A0ABD0ZXU8_CARAN
MDSRAILDSALFQLTPTRTRFDLVLFCGSKKEKLASGIFEPFISHLKFARDQISKGGYSISLHPPTSHSSWFTKSTFDRFVRFVNTPAIIERFATLEKEILQIENSIQVNEIANATDTEQLQNGSSNLRKSKNESENGNAVAGEETSKIQLQRLLETRRTLLRREQAMAYARGVVAGYEIDSIDDLILFADAFGASRLREACVKYKELWKKKHGDGLWMAELAAVKACAPADMSLLGSSGIILTNEGAALSLNGTDSMPSENRDDKSVNLDQNPSGVPNFQAPMGWPNHMPQYFYPPPYQGYPYPPMQPMPNQNQGNMPWPSRGKTSKKKDKRDSDEDESSGSSDSSESDSASDDSALSLEDQSKRHSRTSKNSRRSKKNKKKSSKTVIIRNINYITPEGRNGDMEGNEFTDNGSIKETVDAAVGLLKDNRAYEGENSGEEKRSNENWDSFQNILMRHDDGSDVHSMDVVSEEHFTHRGSSLGANSNGLQTKNTASGDSIIMTQKHITNGGGAVFDHFESEDSARRLPRTRDSTEECKLLLKRSEMLGDESKDMYNGTKGESLVKKSGSGEDWFTSDHRAENNYGRMSFDDSVLTSEGSDKYKKQEFVDDSFMVHSSSLAVDDLYDSRWRPDMAADIALASDIDNGHANEKRDSWEPSDLCMIIERNSGDSLANDYSIDFSAEANARLSSNGTSQEKEDKGVPSGEKKSNVKNPETRKSRTPSRSRAETMSKTVKKPTVASRTMAQKNKFEKEEEMRKRIENLVMERQRRIAERSAMATSRKASLDKGSSRASSGRERAT